MMTIRKMIRDTKGATAIEYGLIAALIAVAAITAMSNLGSSLGVAVAGSVLVGAAVPGGKPFAVALVILGAVALAGFVVAIFIPRPVEADDRQVA